MAALHFDFMMTGQIGSDSQNISRNFNEDSTSHEHMINLLRFLKQLIVMELKSNPSNYQFNMANQSNSNSELRQQIFNFKQMNHNLASKSRNPYLRLLYSILVESGNKAPATVNFSTQTDNSKTKNQQSDGI